MTSCGLACGDACDTVTDYRGVARRRLVPIPHAPEKVARVEIRRYGCLEPERLEQGWRQDDARDGVNAAPHEGLPDPRASARPLYGDNLRSAVPVNVPVKLAVT